MLLLYMRASHEILSSTAIPAFHSQKITSDQHTEIVLVLPDIVKSCTFYTAVNQRHADIKNKRYQLQIHL